MAIIQWKAHMIFEKYLSLKEVAYVKYSVEMESYMEWKGKYLLVGKQDYLALKLLVDILH